jgi:hypothetical protein
MLFRRRGLLVYAKGEGGAVLKTIVVLSTIITVLLLNSCLHLRAQPVALSFSGPVIIDHACTDISKIPDEWIDAAQTNIKWYYAHTSHGKQLTIGLEGIEEDDSKNNVAIDRGWLPREAGAVCILDNPYAGPDHYWRTEAGKRHTEDVIKQDPINVSMWSWCGQAGTYTMEEVQEYLDAMAAFEDAHPEVAFIYMTGHAQQGSEKGYNRHLRNNQIRKWVKDHPEKNRVLFDFADLDSWWYNPDTLKWEQATYKYWNGTEYIAIPIEHSQYHGHERAHTTLESCRQKGKAVWWMLARLAGWKSI